MEAYSSTDEYPPQISQYSNAHEMFYISSTEPLTDPYTYGDLAHEFQHMIHWYQDPNEPTFLDEGFSKLAEFVNGYSSGGNEQVYIANPDINLTDWISGTLVREFAHYGASFLFATYFLDRFGADTTKALIHNQQNGLEKVDSTLAQRNITDPVTGKVITADDFFLDWAVTNYIQDGSVGDGRYVYHNYPRAPRPVPPRPSPSARPTRPAGPSTSMVWITSRSPARETIHCTSKVLPPPASCLPTLIPVHTPIGRTWATSRI